MSLDETKIQNEKIQEKTEQDFTRNIDFKNTTFNAVSLEYFKKRMQFSVALMNPLKTTENLEAYINELSIYKERHHNDAVTQIAKPTDLIEIEESLKIWKLLMGITAVMFLLFGLSGLLTGNIQLSFIALIDLLIFIIAFYNNSNLKKVKIIKKENT